MRVWYYCYIPSYRCCICLISDNGWRGARSVWKNFIHIYMFLSMDFVPGFGNLHKKNHPNLTKCLDKAYGMIPGYTWNVARQYLYTIALSPQQIRCCWLENPKRETIPLTFQLNFTRAQCSATWMIYVVSHTQFRCGEPKKTKQKLQGHPSEQWKGSLLTNQYNGKLEGFFRGSFRASFHFPFSRVAETAPTQGAQSSGKSDWSLGEEVSGIPELNLSCLHKLGRKKTHPPAPLMFIVSLRDKLQTSIASLQALGVLKERLQGISQDSSVWRPPL